MTAAWETLAADTGAARLHVRRQTSGERPLVLLHGLGASGAVWQAFARRLNPAWRCIVPDLRGHGDSEKPPSGYEPADYAADVAALIDSLGEGAVPVVGHSLGALVALAVAARAPERMGAAVLLDPPLDPAIQSAEVPEVYRLRRAPPGELERYLSVPALAPIFRRASDAVFETYLSGPRGARWAWELAPQITAPVLIVQADPKRGGVLGDQAAVDFTAALPRGERLKIDGAPHAVHASHGAEVAKVVLEFLARSSR